MKYLILISTFIISNFTVAQDSPNLFPPQTSTIFTENKIVLDSISTATKQQKLKKKNRGKKKKRAKLQEKTTKNTHDKSVQTAGSPENNGFDIIVFFIIVAIALSVYYCFKRFSLFQEKSFSSIHDDDAVSDQLYRILIPRREYYRNIYLKSKAWKRKRHLVLKRDNWRCVYCGREATQVHHKRYAKVNIGKEPIEWLVSICRSCHRIEHGEDDY